MTFEQYFTGPYQKRLELFNTDLLQKEKEFETTIMDVEDFKNLTNFIVQTTRKFCDNTKQHLITLTNPTGDFIHMVRLKFIYTKLDDNGVSKILFYKVYIEGRD